MSEVQLSSSVVHKGPFQTKQEHSLPSDILRSARNSLESAGLYFSTTAISDAAVRTRYGTAIKRLSRMVQEEVDAGHISAVEGAQFCQAMRNQIMEETRKVTSSWGLASAQTIKKDGLSLEKALDRYSGRLFAKPFQSLNDAEIVAPTCSRRSPRFG